MVKHNHDIYPQYLTIPLGPLTANDTAYTVQIQLPLPRIPTSGKATIMEFLWADIYYAPAISQSLSCSFAVGLSLNKKDIDATNTASYMADPLSLGSDTFSFIKFGTQTAEVFYDNDSRITWQSDDGKGLLVASDTLYCSFDTSQTGSVSNLATIRLYYRFVDVSIQEYVGIVQSQQ